MTWTKGVPLGYYVDRVADIDPATCEYNALQAATDRDGHTENLCNECEADCEVLMRFGDEPDYEARWQDLCAGCLRKALDELPQNNPLPPHLFC